MQNTDVTAIIDLAHSNSAEFAVKLERPDTSEVSVFMIGSDSKITPVDTMVVIDNKTESVFIPFENIARASLSKVVANTQLPTLVLNLHA